MNPFRRFLDFISYPSHSRTIGFLAFLVVLLAVPLTVNIAQKQQELRQRAAFEGGSGGGANITGTTECEQQKGGNYCDNGKCAKFVTKCLPDADLPSNCINQGQDCTPAGGQTSHLYQCSELQPYSCATPAPAPEGGAQTCDGAGGICYPNPDAAARAGATAIIPGTCSVGTCYKKTCDQANGTCYPNPDAAARAGAITIIPGTCSVGQCYQTLNTGDGSRKPCTSFSGTCYTPDQLIGVTSGLVPVSAGACPSGQSCYRPGGGAVGQTGGTCKTDAASAVGCNVGCVTQGGQNMKCHVQNRDAGGTCSSSCTSGGPWNCVIDNAVCPQPTGGGGGGTTCDASKGFIAPCTSSGAIEDNATPCKLADGSTGKSVKQCQGACWYDSYYDTSAAKAPQSQWCYPIGVKLAFTVGLDGIGSTGDQKNPKPDPVSNQSRGSNKSPKHNQRSITVEAIASDGTKTSANGTITYNSTGKYDASVTFDKLAQGVYTFKVKGDIYLKKTIATAIGVSSGQTVTLPAVNLVSGDIDKDNRLSVEDYNFFSPGNCLFKSPTGSCASADLDDDGIIDQYDYNLFIREFAVVQDGD